MQCMGCITMTCTPGEICYCVCVGVCGGGGGGRYTCECVHVSVGGGRYTCECVCVCVCVWGDLSGKKWTIKYLWVIQRTFDLLIVTEAIRHYMYSTCSAWGVLP